MCTYACVCPEAILPVAIVVVVVATTIQIVIAIVGVDNSRSGNIYVLTICNGNGSTGRMSSGRAYVYLAALFLFLLSVHLID